MLGLILSLVIAQFAAADAMDTVKSAMHVITQSLREVARIAKCSHGSVSGSKKELLTKKAEAEKAKMTAAKEPAK